MILPRLIAVVGLAAMIGLAWLMSSHRTRLNTRIIFGGLLLQIVLAIIMLRTPPGQWLFHGIGTAFEHFSGFVDQGAGFVFGDDGTKKALSEGTPIPADSPLNKIYFAFRVLPTIIVFASLMSILYYFGVMQWIVNNLARLMQATLRTSGAESLAAAANVFVGHTEAPLVVRPYINGMTMSELNAMMVGGFATITGGLLAAYAGMGISAGHLVTASVISAPAALLIAKIMQPEVGAPQTMGHVHVEIPRQGVNVIEAAAIGASDGLKLAVNVAVMLLAFLALIAMINAMVGWVGSMFGMEWSLEAGLGYVFAPLAWLMGIEFADCWQSGQLLGIKMVANEFIAYSELGGIIQSSKESQDAVACAMSAVNGCPSVVPCCAGQFLLESVHNAALMESPSAATIAPPELSERTQYILTYALSGFSNFGAIGIQIGGIGGLAPDRRPDLARLGLRAMIGGTLACCMTACIAGILI